MNVKTFSSVALGFVVYVLPTSSNAGVCEYAKTTYAKFATLAAGAGVATGAVAKAGGLISLAHSSGAAIAATTSGGYLAGTLGAGGTAVAILTSPATLAVGGTAVLGAGGTIAYCRYVSDKAPPVSTSVAPRKGK